VLGDIQTSYYRGILHFSIPTSVHDFIQLAQPRSSRNSDAGDALVTNRWSRARVQAT
jgi:hypothetical protein